MEVSVVSTNDDVSGKGHASVTVQVDGRLYCVDLYIDHRNERVGWAARWIDEVLTDVHEAVKATMASHPSPDLFPRLSPHGWQPCSPNLIS